MKFFTVACMLICSAGLVSAQVGVNSSGNPPDASSMLDVSSTQHGVLIPRMTQGQRDAINSPAYGLLVYNTTSGCINMWAGSTWRQLCGACDFSDPVAGNNGPICAGGTLQLTAATITGATYSWTGPNGFTSSLQNPSIANTTVGASGTYSVTATLNGCTSQPQSTVATVNPVPQSPNAGASPNPVCGNDPLNLTASTVSGATYSWSGPDNFVSALQNPSIPAVNVNQSGTFSVTATISGCTSPPGSVNVTVNAPTPSAPGSISGPASVCSGTAGHVYSISAVSGASTYNWSVPSGATITSGAGTTSITVTFGTTSGNVSVTAQNSCGTSSATSTAVTVNPYPLTTFTTSTPTKNIPITFTPTSGGGSSYSWTFQSGSPGTSTAQNPVVTWSAGGTFNVGLTLTVNGCSSTGSGTITVVGGPFQFTTCSQTGRSGPSQAQCNSAYTGSDLAGNVTVTSGIQYWTVPANGTYRIEVWGARSGFDNSGGSGDVGLGARMRGDFALTQGQVLKILVGQEGGNNPSSSSAGGGGGSFVATSTNPALIVAGGGGALEGSGGPFSNQHGTVNTNGQNGLVCGAFAGGTNCNGATADDGDNHGGGGAGFCTNGVGVGSGGTHFTPAQSFVNGGVGGEAQYNNAFGGFGGGGGAWGNGGGAGGGGGYSGGGAGDNCSSAPAGGGGSFNNGTNTSNSTGVNNGPGAVTITYQGL